MSILVWICIISVVTSSPIPQRLTEEDFGRSFNDELSDNNKVDIFSGYAKVSFSQFKVTSSRYLPSLFLHSIEIKRQFCTEN